MTTAPALGPPSATIAYGGTEITLTVIDAKAIEASLIAYLELTDTNDVEDRDYLLARTRGARRRVVASNHRQIGLGVLGHRFAI